MFEILFGTLEMIRNTLFSSTFSFLLEAVTFTFDSFPLNKRRGDPYLLSVY